jgi:hypothetical protein
VADELFGRLRRLLLLLDADSGHVNALPAVHVFDSATVVALRAPDSSSGGPSGDWVNEIHPNRAGYAKLGAAMGPWMEQVIAAARGRWPVAGTQQSKPVGPHPFGESPSKT